jgi:hypothetical protein
MFTELGNCEAETQCVSSDPESRACALSLPHKQSQHQHQPAVWKISAPIHPVQNFSNIYKWFAGTVWKFLPTAGEPRLLFWVKSLEVVCFCGLCKSLSVIARNYVYIILANLHENEKIHFRFCLHSKVLIMHYLFKWEQQNWRLNRFVFSKDKYHQMGKSFGWYIDTMPHSNDWERDSLSTLSQSSNQSRSSILDTIDFS